MSIDSPLFSGRWLILQCGAGALYFCCLRRRSYVHTEETHLHFRKIFGMEKPYSGSIRYQKTFFSFCKGSKQLSKCQVIFIKWHQLIQSIHDGD